MKEPAVEKKGLQQLLAEPETYKKVGIIRLKMVREETCIYGKKKIATAKDSVDMVKQLFAHIDREMMVVVSFSTAMEPLAIEVVAIGGLDACYIDVKNVFKHAILNNAGNIICFHNHPSSQLLPSREDEKITRKLKEAGCLLGVKLNDHIILSEDGYYSFAEEGLL